MNKQGAALARVLGKSNFALMRGHGSVAVGNSIKQAVYRGIYAEVNARDYRYTARAGARELSPVQVLKACNCLEYQSCEHPGWEDSQARANLEVIRAYAVRQLPGYEDADWTLDAWKPELLVAGGAA